ncbi:hypothetical protein DM15PD_00710 [Aristophania vespae]|nr:hypothetical protein DM15PD_00710 [Aristophania vespae]
MPVSKDTLGVVRENMNSPLSEISQPGYPHQLQLQNLSFRWLKNMNAYKGRDILDHFTCIGVAEIKDAIVSDGSCSFMSNSLIIFWIGKTSSVKATSRRALVISSRSNKNHGRHHNE